MKDLIGSSWLQEKYGLQSHILTHKSYIGARSRVERNEEGYIAETYPPHYRAKKPTPLTHIEFSCKYDDLNLDFLANVFNHISENEIIAYLKANQKGQNERRIGYFYEFLTGNRLALPDQGKSNYIDLLDPKRYVTGRIIKIKRWNINDNQLGVPGFCPVIRRTTSIEDVLEDDYRAMVEEIGRTYPAGVFYRAINYLYTKETKSSYQIEREKPTPERIGRFVQLLEKAGELPAMKLLSEANLTALQSEIVDPRYAAVGFRNFQNYVGQTSYNYKEIIHYICPPPAMIQSIMEGLATTATKSEGAPAVIRAAIISFGFVFAHPFEDGNGRLHRFLIHDMLTRDKIVPAGMIIPVSANMVNHIKEYDKILETYSGPLMKRIRYDLNETDHSLVVNNPEQVATYFRYPDLTEQSVYLAKTIKNTIKEDIFWEMDFLVKYDEVKSAIQDIVDMPDRDIDLLIKLLHQHRGILSVRKRKLFEKLTDEELSKMETAFQEIFVIGQAKPNQV